MTDPIADMLTRIRNAVAVKKPELVLPWSKIKFNIAKLLENENYLGQVEEITTGKFNQLKIKLAYSDGTPNIQHIKRISKPGQRVYVAGKEIPRVLSGYGLAVLSTSQGIMAGRDAFKNNVGGELICEIW
jgi:small subunit ribosomal protein S8